MLIQSLKKVCSRNLWKILLIFPVAAFGQAATNSLIVLDEGINHRIVAAISTNYEGGLESIRTNTAFTILEAGLNYLDETGTLRASSPFIEAVAGGAEVRNSGLKVRFNTDINSEGAIDLTTAGGKRIRGTPLGLSYFDAATGQSVLIAEIRSTIGSIVTPHRVVYEDFLDEVLADAVYDVSKRGVMQTIIIREKILPPSAYGLSDETTRLEVITEFVDTVQPEQENIVLKREEDPAKRAEMVKPDFTDTILTFGDVIMPQGIAFGLNAQPKGDGLRKEKVGKTWEQRPAEDRSILFEAVEYIPAKEHLDILPEVEADPNRPMAANVRALPARRLPLEKTEYLAIAKSNYEPMGFALDWEVLSPIETMTFNANETYVVHGQVNIRSAIFKPGTVIKFDARILAGTQDGPHRICRCL